MAYVGVREGPARFEQKVMVKLARRDDREAAAALGREARVCARLDHPAIPQVYDLFDQDGEATLVLQWTDSVTLESILEEGRLHRVRMPLAAVAHLGTQLFSALDAAHTARDPRTREFAPIVHQGVNPAAIRVAPDGRLRLGDFGSSRTLAALDLTPAGLLGAHEGYLAPEQLLGDRPSVRTDVYSACLVLRELLTGRQAFPSGDVDYLRWLERIARPELLDITAYREDLDASLVWLLRVGLRPERDARSVTAAIAAQVLASVANGADGAAALVEYLQHPSSIVAEPFGDSDPRLQQPPSFEDDEVPTVSLRRARTATPPPLPVAPAAPPVRSRPALDVGVARTPEPMQRTVPAAASPPSITWHPTLPSIRRQRPRAPWVLAPAAVAVLGLLTWLGSRPWSSGAIRASAPPVATEHAAVIVPPATVVPAIASVAEVPAATLTGSAIASPAEIRRLLADTHAKGTFERCFVSGDQPANGVTLRTRCKGGATFTLLVINAPGHSERRIGAYSSAMLDLWTGWRADPRAALFALDPYRLYPVRVPSLAVDNRDGSFGPSFGGGHDLHVAGSLKTGLTVPKSFLTRNDEGFAGMFGPFRIHRIEVFVARTLP